MNIIGYLLFHRSILDTDLYQFKPSWWFKLYWHLVTQAFYEDGHHLEKGQLHTSYQKLMDDFLKNDDIKINSISKALKYLETEKLIERKQSKLGLYITICNYDQFCISEQESIKAQSKLSQSSVKAHIENEVSNKENKESSISINPLSTETIDGGKELIKFDSDSVEVKLCRKFILAKQRLDAKFKYPGKGKEKEKALASIQNWAAIFDSLMRIDERSKEDIEKIIEYIGSGNCNHSVNAPKSLRAKYSDLFIAMNRINNNHKSGVRQTTADKNKSILEEIRNIKVTETDQTEIKIVNPEN